MRDTLYVLRPGFEDQGQGWFCPYSAQVVGMLTYYPQLRETVDVVELGFEKPRQPVAELIGESNQSLPVLLLGDAAPESVPGVTIGEVHGHRFVTRTIEILRYLAATRGLPPPH
jgi:hypothetical protein